MLRRHQRQNAVAVQAGPDREVERHHDHAGALDEQLATGLDVWKHRLAQKVRGGVDEGGDDIAELGAAQHRVLARPLSDHVLNVGERLGQPRDQGLGLVDDGRHEQRADAGDGRQRRHDRRHEAHPASESEPPLEQVGERRQINGAQGRDEDEEQHLGHPEDEPDGEGGNEERHERGARQP